MLLLSQSEFSQKLKSPLKYKNAKEIPFVLLTVQLLGWAVIASVKFKATSSLNAAIAVWRGERYL